MPTFQCPNPECRTQSEIPDKFVGMKVRCKQCRTEFMAGTRTPAPAVIPPLPPTVINSPPPLAPTTSAKKIPTTASTKVSTVAAVWREPGGGGGVGWVIGAVAAFLLPVAAAAGFLALRWTAKPAAPASELYAGIEVGSSGVTYTIFDVTRAPDNTFDYQVLLFDSKTTNINRDMAKTGVFHPEGMAAAVKAIRECFAKLTETDKIPAERIFVVSSGGLLGALSNQPAARRAKLLEENQSELRRAIKTAVAKTIDFIDAEEEAGYQLDAVVEPGNLEKSVYIDIGSGGTRGAYRDGAGRLQKFRVSGINEFVEKAKTYPGGLANGNGSRLATSLIADKYRTQAKEAEGFRVRENVYLGGGIVWVLSIATHPKEQIAPPEKGLHVPMTVDDINGFVADIRKGKDFRQSYAPPVGLSPEDTKKLQTEVKRTQKPFSSEKLTAGAEILSSLAAEMKWSGRTLKFPRYAHVSWVMGYIAKQSELKR
jgi:hypothetical protein